MKRRVEAIQKSEHHEMRFSIVLYSKLLLTTTTLLAMLAMPAVASSPNGDKFSSRLLELVRVVLPANGYINKEMHASLWDEAPIELLRELESDNGEAFKQQLQKQFNHALLFQFATWDSVRRTLESGEISYHPDYAMLHKITVNEGYVTAANNGDRVIKSALDRTPIENSQGMFYITKALASTVLNNLDVSLERASLLFNQTWNPKLQERFLRRAHVKTISSLPYAFTEDIFDGLTVTFYTSQLSKISSKSVMWLPMDEQIAPSESILEEMTVSLLEYYWIDSSEAFTYSSKWRGNLSHKGSGVGYIHGIKASFSISTIMRFDLDGVLVFIGISEHSNGEADRFLEELLEQSQLTN